jgi:hypothetical protein
MAVMEKLTFHWSADARKRFKMHHQKRLLSTADDRLAKHVFQACEHGLDQNAFDAIRVDGIFSQVRNTLEDDYIIGTDE